MAKTTFATPDDVSVIRNLKSQGEPQFKHQTEVSLPGDIGFNPDQTRKVQERLISFSPLIQIKTDTEQGPSKNSHWYFIKDDDCAPYTMSFREYEDGLTLSYFLAWRGLMINSDGTYNPPKFWKRSVEVRMLKNAAGKPLGSAEAEISRQIWLVGSFPDSLTFGEIDYSSSEPQILEISMTYDGPKFDTGIKTKA